MASEVTSSRIASTAATVFAPIASGRNAASLSADASAPSNAFATRPTMSANASSSLRGPSSSRPAFLIVTTASANRFTIAIMEVINRLNFASQPAPGPPHFASALNVAIAFSTALAICAAALAAASSGSTTCGRILLPDPPGRLMFPRVVSTSPRLAPRSCVAAFQLEKSAAAAATAASPAAAMPAIALCTSAIAA